jgi:hypothetical protein
VTRSWIGPLIAANLGALVGLAFVYPREMVSPGALAPAHAALASRCFSCHEPFRGASAERCLACHAIAEIGIRTTSGGPIEPRADGAIDTSFHRRLSDQDCVTCHSEHHLRTERRFSHALLSTAVRERCESCHAAPTSELHRDLGVSCKTCHTTEHWIPATFDHALLAKATLDRCESCHRPPNDPFHGQVGGACAECHSPLQWKPSTFNHDRFFVLDRDHTVACATCHTNQDFKHYTCYGCHEHTPANIRAEHEEEGIRDFADCVACHRSAEGEPSERGGGREHDEEH